MRYFFIAIVQFFVLWLVIQLWRAIGPIVGLPGLAVWVGALYWLAHRWDRDAERRLGQEWQKAAEAGAKARVGE
jgi:hypothetical protein